jgi:hypothetical protein
MPAVNSIDSPNAPAPPPQGTRYLPQDAPQGPRFQYSTCTGRRKALLIGINYFGQRGQLRGCINDVKNMTAFLNDCFGYKRDDMVILTDCQQNPMSQPTKQNVLRAMHWLVKDSQPNDSLFFHFSGKRFAPLSNFRRPLQVLISQQVTVVRLRVPMETRADTTKSSTQSTSAAVDILSTTKCIEF